MTHSVCFHLVKALNFKMEHILLMPNVNHFISISHPQFLNSSKAFLQILSPFYFLLIGMVLCFSLKAKNILALRGNRKGITKKTGKSHSYFFKELGGGDPIGILIFTYVSLKHFELQFLLFLNQEIVFNRSITKILLFSLLTTKCMPPSNTLFYFPLPS